MDKELSQTRIEASSLLDVAKACAKSVVGQSVHSEGERRFCVGFHIRNVLDLAAPAVAVVASDQSKAENIKMNNDRFGLHTLNHVLDSLYYPPFFGRPLAGASAIIVRMTYSMQGEESCHHFDEEPEAGFSTWEQIQSNEKSDLKNILEGFDFRYIRMGVRENSNLVTLSGSSEAEDVPGQLFRPESEFYNEYVCGAQKLCCRLAVIPSVVAYRSLMAAVYQLASYANRSAFGLDTVTVMLRPSSTFGYVIGFTLIASSLIESSELLSILPMCLGYYRKMQIGVVPIDGLSAKLPTRTYKRFSFGEKLTAIPGKIADLLSRGLCESGPGEASLMAEDKLRFTVQSFLKMAVGFCDERLEGRDLSYGLILGNAPLMAYWPGPMPRPLQRNRFFLQVNELSKQVHILEDPESQCIVIPYIGGDFTQSTPCPAWMLDLTEFEEALSAWPEGISWSRDLRPYVYLTQRYPWALAAVVGPGSQIRVFFRGRLQAYRDGKGWRLYYNPVDQIRRECPNWFSEGTAGDEDRRLLGAVFEAALQMSPIARGGAHGGLLVYVPAEESESRELLNNNITSVREFEPDDGSGRSWLKGRQLINQQRSEGAQNLSALNYRTGRLLQRASILDGAIVLCRPYGKVIAFSQRLSYSDASATGAGTKRQTAESFVTVMGRDQSRADAFAVAISSDGPIAIYIYDKLAGEYRRFDAFKEEECLE